MVDDGTTDDPGGSERREHPRYDVELSVDYASGETFLFSYITNISEMGIFLRTENPSPVGTEIRLRFSAGDEVLELPGMVVWVNPVRPMGDNPNPGMGIRFSELNLAERERVVSLVRTVAYLQDAPGN